MGAACRGCARALPPNEEVAMADINTPRVILGGLVAGLVVNVVESIMNMFVIVGPMEEILSARNLEPVGQTAIAGFTVLAFTLGIVMVWLYAAIRPRYGEGPATALRAGAAAWLLFYLLPLYGNWLFGFIPTSMLGIGAAYTLPMMLAAGYAGGMLYKEG
jgi:hypothetical protein